MKSKPTDTQIGAWQSVDALCKQTARAAWLTAKAEGVNPMQASRNGGEDIGMANVLLEWYDALSEMRDQMERKWPGVNRWGSQWSLR